MRRKTCPQTPLYPAGVIPDAVVLTPAAEPCRMQTINWRVASNVNIGLVLYRQANAPIWQTASGQCKQLVLPDLTDDRITNHFFATLTDLKPATTYQYKVGSDKGWSPEYRFTTAPEGDTPFTFAYLGDVQEGFAGVGEMLQKLESTVEAPAFYLAAGDLVSGGENRNDWDTFFHSTQQVFAHKFLAPTPGNHDYHYNDLKGPVAFVKYFQLPPNGARRLPQNLSYTFSYANAFFIVPDSNQSLFKQTKWLVRNLKAARKKGFVWLVLLMHHPVYSAKGRRTKYGLRKTWRALFDKYQVDLVFTGHDHSYLRSHPLCRDKITRAGGTVYVVSTAGSHYYRTCESELAACQISQLQTYQLVDVKKDAAGNQVLSYSAFNFQGQLVDNFQLVKTSV